MSTDIMNITSAAKNKIIQLINGDQQLRLRVYVQGGGCSGFKYGFGLDKKDKPGDQILNLDGCVIVIDQFSVQYVNGATLDYIEDVLGRNFVVTNNSNVATTCSCGASFDA